MQNIYLINLSTPVTFPLEVPSTIQNPRLHVDSPNVLTQDTTFTFNNLYDGITRFVLSGNNISASDSLLRNINSGTIKLKYVSGGGIACDIDFTKALSDELEIFSCIGLNNANVKLDLTKINGTYPLITAFGMGYNGIAVGTRNGNIIGTVSDLLRVFPNISSNLLVYYSKISGDISGFAATPSITNLGVQGTNITGTVESLVAEMCAAGRVEGTLHCAAHNTAVTFHNAAVPSIGGAAPGLQIAFTSTGATVSQDGVTLATYTKTSGTWTYNS